MADSPMVSEVSNERTHRLKRRSALARPEARLGLVVGLLVLLVAVFGPLLSPYSAITVGLAQPLSPPSSAHLLGTDSLGRDVLSRVLSGGGSLLLIAVLSVIVSQVAGTILGLIAAYWDGRADTLISRFFDVFLTLPPLLLALALITGLGYSIVVLVAIVGLVYTPRAGRIVRASARDVMSRAYIMAAKSRGESAGFVLAREVIPNIAGPALADLALRMTYAVTFVATLNFLGLGVQPPTPDWGLMVAENRATIYAAPLAVFAPAVAIALLSVSVNLVADALTAFWSPETADILVGF